MVTTHPQFPLVDALLLTPSEGTDGMIGICTNTSAPGQIFNEIEEINRKAVSVLGPLIVSRDGSERMILNCLAHPTIKYVILFSEESLTFSPSTNLLQALHRGLSKEKGGNYIIDGCGASAHYPNLSESIIDSFRKNIVVLPLFMHKHPNSSKVITEYLSWIRDKVPIEIYDFLILENQKKKIYYDSLNTLIKLLISTPSKQKESIELDPKEFQHLQPPKIKLDEKEVIFSTHFCVTREQKSLRLDIKVGENSYFIRGNDDFRIEYSLMKFLGERKKEILILDQMLIGAELNRVHTEILNDVSSKPFVSSTTFVGDTEIILQSKVDLLPDKEYYYKIGVTGETISVMCMAFDVCEEVFELQSKGFSSIVQWLAKKNRFQKYEMDILHRMDIGGQIGRAVIAAKSDYLFIQDFASIFKINKTDLPLLVTEGDNFLDIHRGLLLKIYTQGITEEHGDSQKGSARTGISFAIYRNAEKALIKMPLIYKQGELSTKKMRSEYKKQLLRLDHDGDYSYGERTRSFFKFDQLEKATQLLKKDPSKAVIIQRFDPSVDMGSFLEKETGETKYTHDPCLTHDIFFIKENKLHSLHIARAHNMSNAYPENIFGIYDAYVSKIKSELKIQGGDMYMLSNRANILLLTEEQRVRKIVAEPSKPIGDVNRDSGPYLVAENTKKGFNKGLSYSVSSIPTINSRPNSSFLDHIESYDSINTLERAINYLHSKGASHNNPVLSTHKAGRTGAQDEHMAFFQANVFGSKIHATAVFTNHSIKNISEDEILVGYISTMYSKKLNFPLGKMTIFYIN